MVRCLRNMLSQPSGAFIFCISTQPLGTASVLCLLGSIQWSLFSARRQGRPRLAASKAKPLVLQGDWVEGTKNGWQL